jgi:hypothetical protein
VLTYRLWQIGITDRGIRINVDRGTSWRARQATNVDPADLKLFVNPIQLLPGLQSRNVNIASESKWIKCHSDFFFQSSH